MNLSAGSGQPTEQIPQFDTSRRKSVGCTIKCLRCPSKFNNKFKAITHYAITHNLYPCIICSRLFATHLDRITHENETHWPYRCLRCPEKFLNIGYLEVHTDRVHSMRTCPLCPDTCSTAATFKQHLQKKHSVVESAVTNFPNENVAIFVVIETTPIKFHCMLCDQQKQLPFLITHCQDGHKVDFSKLLNFTMTLNAEHLEYVGNTLPVPERPVKRPIKADSDDDDEDDRIDATIKRIASSAVNKVANSMAACQYTMVPKDNASQSDGEVKPLSDYDTNIVHCIVSTDEGSDDEDSTTAAELIECPYCRQTFPCVRELGQHMQKAHGFRVIDNAGGANRCRTCHKNYASRSGLLKHRNSMHLRSKSDGRRRRQCPACDDNCENYSRRELRTHIREHIDLHRPCDSDELGFRCRFCTLRFWTVDQKNEHQLARHWRDIGDAFMLCSECGNMFTSMAALRWHLFEAHTKSPDHRMLYKCEICKITMPELAALAAHMRKVHPSRKLLFCPLKRCGVVVTDWDFHVRLQHKDHLQRYFQYKCKQCDGLVEATDKAADKHMHDQHPPAPVNVIDLIE